MRFFPFISASAVISTAAFIASCSSESSSVGIDPSVLADKRWGKAGLVEPHVGNAHNAQVVLFENGSALAVWRGTETPQSPRRIYSNRLIATDAWSIPQTIDVASGDPFLPRLASNANGDVVTVWTSSDPNGSDQLIYANSFSSTAGWGVAQALQMSGSLQNPKVAVNDEGTALAVWQETDSLGARSVVSSRFTAATGWESVAPIGQANGVLTLPDVGIDANGNGVATWLDRPPSGNNDLVASRFTAGVGWSMIEAVESLDGAARVFDVALNAEGNGLATWWQSDGDIHGLYASRYEAASGWSAAEEIGPSGATPGNLSLALADNGVAVVVWQHETAESRNIYAVNRAPDGTWSSPQRIDALEGIGSQPKVAIDADGDATAVWLQNDGQTDSVYAAQFDPVDGWGPQLILETENGIPARWFEARAPAVVMNRAGDALVIWTQFDGESYSLYSNSYSAMD